MTEKEIVQALRRLRVETGSLACVGCGWEHNCGTHGCKILREAAAQAERIPSDAARPTCLEPVELHQYLGAATGFGWHISNLKIYDTPRELDDFRRACKNDWWCESCAMYSENNGTCGNGSLQIRRPPQSWCYVEGDT